MRSPSGCPQRPRRVIHGPIVAYAWRWVVDQETQPHDDSARGVTPQAGVAYVVVLFGSTAGAIHTIGRGGLVIGRRSDAGGATLAFDDGRMSRMHVRIGLGAAGWQLVDLDSRNGGFVDGVPFSPAATVDLASGSVLRIGDTLLAFRVGPTSDNHDDEREAFPGASPPAADVRRRLGLIARGRGHVLVLGETGTGKERIARRIGRGCSFIPQNCAELTRELARSELFGHARGAFSGATSAKQGLVDAAGDGVLFLDEIGELPLDVQGDLLRFLEDGSYRPVGATDLRVSRARVVAATNVDLDAAVRIGAFRRDLLARLRAANAPLVLPPLRERREDILGWARRFLDEANPSELPPVLWTAGAAECLVLYPWPENLRELGGAMRALVESPPTWPIESSALPDRLQTHRRAMRDRQVVDAEASVFVDDPSRDAIERALVETGGRMRAASMKLGIDRRKLYRLCERFGIDISNYRPV